MYTFTTLRPATMHYALCTVCYCYCSPSLLEFCSQSLDKSQLCMFNDPWCYISMSRGHVLCNCVIISSLPKPAQTLHLNSATGLSCC